MRRRVRGREVEMEGMRKRYKCGEKDKGEFPRIGSGQHRGHDDGDIWQHRDRPPPCWDPPVVLVTQKTPRAQNNPKMAPPPCWDPPVVLVPQRGNPQDTPTA